MHRKIIFWRNNAFDERAPEGKKYAQVHYSVTYNQSTFQDYQDMVAELRKTFPEIENDKIKCGKVTQSHYCDGATIIWFGGYIEKRSYEGWTETDSNPDYMYY